ncbi:MAG TPA: S8 family peptidase [Pyrinomonadaceae bacterium]|nr:S8 family peptidase [Pyrinomonadaceae bacterium]
MRIAISFLLTTILLLWSVAGFKPVMQLETKVLAAGVSKVSPDLRDKVNSGASGQIPVVFVTPSAPTTSLQSAVTGGGGAVKKNLKNVRELTATLPASQIDKLAARTDVSYIALDRPVRKEGHLEITTGAYQARNYGTSTTGTINGTGIGIAVLDSGIAPNHHSFFVDNTSTSTRIVANVNFVSNETITNDPYGHGTHVAAMAAGSNHVASGAYTGVAPRANIVNVRVLNSQGTGSASDVVAGVDWCIANKATYNIRVINMSLGTTAVDSYQNDPLCLAVRRAVDAGIVVVVSAGNAGKDASGNKIFGSIHSPGIEPSAITVGAANTFGTDGRTDDQVTTYSSRGPTRGFYTDPLGVKHYDNLIKPDLIAPGNKMIQAEAPGNAILASDPSLDTGITTNIDHKMMYMSGTSMAAPAVAGAAALLVQRNPGLTPNMVKAILEYTSNPLRNFNTLEQGAGLLNVEGAVRLAGAVRANLSSAPPALGAPLLSVSAPSQTSNIAGQNFQWGGGIIQRWNFLTGSNLILKYQKIYGQSSVENAGVLLSDGVLSTDGVLVTDGVLISDGVLVSDGVLLADGVLLSDGVLQVMGITMSEGVLLSDGVLISDGVLLSDSVLGTSAANTSLAQSVIKLGDNTGSFMNAVDDFVVDVVNSLPVIGTKKR